MKTAMNIKNGQVLRDDEMKIFEIYNFCCSLQVAWENSKKVILPGLQKFS